MASLALGFVGSIVRLAAYQGATFETFAAGHVIIGIATIIFMIQVALNENTLQLTTVMSTLPAGYLLSQLLTQIIFTKESSYLTHADESVWKLEIYMAVQSVLILASLVYAFIHSKNENIYVTNVIVLAETTPSFKTGLTTVFKTNKNVLFIILSFGLFYSSFVLQLQKWVHISNQFNFTPVRFRFLSNLSFRLRVN